MQNKDRTKTHWVGRTLRNALRTTSLIAPVLLAGGAAFGFSAADVYRNSSSSVVLIFGFSDSGAGSSGTGSILTKDGLVLTNNHVVANSETGRLFPNLVVYFKPNPISGDNRKDLTTPYLVDVISRDPDLDLALLRIKDAPAGLRPVEVANSDEVEIGESVAAIGHPGGGGLWTLTTGTISSKRRDQSRDIFQTDTAINPGNSGGPLLDEYSRLVGVNTFVRRVNDQGLPLEGLNYSLRSSFAVDWVNHQGVTKINMVPRTRIANPVRVDQGGMRATPQTTPQPPAPPVLRMDAEPTTDPDEMAEVEPQPDTRIEPDPDPEPLAKPVMPVPAPPADPKAREFEGANGEKMYGVPNPTIDLHEALVEARKGYQKLIKRADDSVDEMDRLLDDYDNF